MNRYSNEISFFYYHGSKEGHILGGGWDITYHADHHVNAWMMANRDGFVLADRQYNPAGVTRVVRR